MLFKDEYAFSLLPKVVFLTAIICATLLGGYLMFADENNLVTMLKPYKIKGFFTRQIIIMVCLIIYVIRLFITLFVFLKRKMAWSEMLLVTALMSFALFSFAKVGGNSQQEIGALDYLAIFLYASGSWINSWSEYTRYLWKKSSKNRGKIYNEGLFKYALHINYFGDIVLFTGLALLTVTFSLLLIPLAMALNFVFFIIPRLDSYLAIKYGADFKENAKTTKKLIPGIY